MDDQAPTLGATVQSVMDKLSPGDLLVVERETPGWEVASFVRSIAEESFFIVEQATRFRRGDLALALTGAGWRVVDGNVAKGASSDIVVASSHGRMCHVNADFVRSVRGHAVMQGNTRNR